MWRGALSLPGIGICAEMHAIGLGALQQGDVPQARIARLHRIHQVGQHRRVGGDLVGLQPALAELRLLEQRAVDDAGDAAQRRQRRAAGLRIRQVDGEEARALSNSGFRRASATISQPLQPRTPPAPPGRPGRARRR